MASVQATIPFKIRKKTCLNRKVETADENIDISNTLKPLKGRRVPKRRLKSAAVENDENDKCSPVKISRPQQNEDIEEEKTNCLTPLTSREKEIEWMFNFLMDHLESQESASLYVSGQPGTGKTASLSYIIQHPKVQAGYRVAVVNCTALKSAASVFARVCAALGLRAAPTEKASRAALHHYLYSQHQLTLVVLDEIDQLDSKRQEVLYTLFEWAGERRTRLVLIGVANALDLTQRALPRLQTRHYRPHTLHFPPYSKEQIVNIFTKVLADEDKGNVFSPVALQMLAAKIASVSGDMRRALDIGRRVIELARRSKFADNQSVEAMLEHSTVTVELKQVLQVLNTVYGGSRTIEQDELPMQQKLILCSLILMLTKGKNKNIVMGKLHDVYKKVASARNVAALDMSELCGACSLLEARGALRLAAGGGRARRLALAWDHAELAAALKDQPLLAAILRDTCL